MEPKTPKIKVLMPVLHYPPVIGGFEVFIQNIAERLGKEMPVFVVTGRVKGVKDYEEKGDLKIIRTSLWPLANLSYTSKTYRLMALFFIFCKSWRIIKKEGDPALREERGRLQMHCHGFFSGLIGLALKKLTGVPYLITIQSADLNIYHPRLEKKFWRLIHFWDFLKFLEKKIYLNAFKCHSVSEYLSDYYGDYGIKDSVVIPNGVDQELFKSIKDKKDLIEKLREKLNKKHNLNLTPGMKILVNVSRLEKKNGVDILIEALPLLNFGDYILLIIGDGSERKYLEQLVKGLSLESKVRFLGDMVNTEIPEYLQVADLFVRIPLAEGFGIVYIEAMACGTPAIGTSVGGIPDIFTADKTELLCKENDRNDAADKINNFFNNEFTIHKIIDWMAFKQRYNWNNITEEIKKIYLQPRLVIATGIYPPDIGGPATYSESLFRELPKHDFNVKVITYSDFKKSKVKSQKSKVQVKNQNYPFGIIRINRERNLFLRYFSYFWNLKKLAANADLIYAQCPLGSGLPAYWVGKITRKPYIIKITGDYAWEQAQNRFGIKDLIGDFQTKKYNWRIELMRWLEKLTTKNAQRVIVPSQYLKKIVEGWGIDEGKIGVIYNSFESGIKNQESEIVGNKNFCSSHRENFILSAGRLEPWKGFDALIKLMPQLPPELKLIIAGDGPEEQNLKNKIVGLKLESQVGLVGRIPSSELKNYYERAKMFVLNTAYEGLSHILLEAMAGGAPIVTTNIGGNPEVIENGVNGLLVDYNNLEQIKEAILRIYNHPDWAETFVQNGYEKLKQFSFEKMINETIKLLYEIIND